MRVPGIATRVAGHVTDPRALGVVSMRMFEAVVKSRRIWIRSSLVVEMMCRRASWRILDSCRLVTCYVSTYMLAQDRLRQTSSEDGWITALRLYQVNIKFDGYRSRVCHDHWVPVPRKILRSILRRGCCPERWDRDARILVMKDCCESRDLKSLDILIRTSMVTPIDVYILLGRQRELLPERVSYVLDPKCLIDPELIECMRDSEKLSRAIIWRIGIPFEVLTVWEVAGLLSIHGRWFS